MVNGVDSIQYRAACNVALECAKERGEDHYVYRDHDNQLSVGDDCQLAAESIAHDRIVFWAKAQEDEQ